MELEFNEDKVCYPFKFNKTWLLDYDFCSLVEKWWSPHQPRFSSSPIVSLVKKLNLLKFEVAKWDHDTKTTNRLELVSIESELDLWDLMVDDHMFSADRKYVLLKLEGCKDEILKQ